MEQSVSETNEVKVKTHYTGKVLKTSLAGALVDIGTGTPAYLHVSQVPTQDSAAIKRLEEILPVGQEVEVWVKRIREGRVELTMIKPLDLDWKDLKPEMVVKGKVVKLEKFGAFIEIGAERPGLVHISEMAHGYVKTPGDVVKEGDEVEAQILDVNRKKKQIKLSLKALVEPPVVEEAPVQLMDRDRPERGKNDDNRRRKPAPKGKRRGEEKSEGSYLDLHDESGEPEPTAMEILLRAAMEKAKDKKDSSPSKGKEKKKVSHDAEDIFSRTLEQKPKN